MSKKEEAKKTPAETKIKRSDLSVVAEDTNWRISVAKEEQIANAFFEDWGFLTKAAQGKLDTLSLTLTRWQEDSSH